MCGSVRPCLAERLQLESAAWRELSRVLDHIEKISELDLDGVVPTSHVIELENVFRADEPRESWPRERVIEGAPDVAEGGFRVPTPGQ